MLFNSLSFVVLVFSTFLLYYLPVFKKFQRLLLLIASFIFYAYNQPILLFLLLTSVSVNTLTSYVVYHSAGVKAKIYAVTGVMINLAGIAFFKYSPLLGQTFLNLAIQ